MSDDYQESMEWRKWAESDRCPLCDIERISVKDTCVTFACGTRREVIDDVSFLDQSPECERRVR